MATSAAALRGLGSDLDTQVARGTWVRGRAARGGNDGRRPLALVPQLREGVQAVRNRPRRRSPTLRLLPALPPHPTGGICRHAGHLASRWLVTAGLCAVGGRSQALGARRLPTRG